ISARGEPRKSVWLAKAVVTPRTRFDPERLCATRSPCACTMSANMRATVVLPFVPATTIDPAGSRRAILPTSPGSMRSATSPGAAVPPPRPSLRIAAPVTLAAATAATNRASGAREDLRAIGEDNCDDLELLERDERNDR